MKEYFPFSHIIGQDQPVTTYSYLEEWSICEACNELKAEMSETSGNIVFFF